MKAYNLTLVDPEREVIGYSWENAQMEAGIFEKLLSDPVPMECLPCSKIASGKITIPKTDRRKVMYNGKLSDFLAETNCGTITFKRNHVQDGNIRMILTLGLPENTGLALVVAINSGQRGRVLHIFTPFQKNHVWDSTCQKCSVFFFSKSMLRYVVLLFIRKSTGCSTISAVSGWTATPQTDFVLSWEMFIDQ